MLLTPHAGQAVFGRDPASQSRRDDAPQVQSIRMWSLSIFAHSFLVNGATRGDKQGTVAVIEWDSLALTGEQEFNFTFKHTGVFCLGIRAIIGGNATMFRLDLNSVA